MPERPLALRLTVFLLVSVGVGLGLGPLGWSGRGLAVGVLLAVNALLLIGRPVLEEVPDVVALPVLWGNAVTSAALVLAAEQGSPYVFSFFVAGHAGYRLATRPAVATALFSAVFTTVALILGHGGSASWALGLSTGLPVLIGMMNRARAVGHAAEVDAARSAERARIARDVHDVLAHSLAGVNLQLELADALLEAGDLEKAREATGRAQSLVREGMRESRRSLQTLREGVLPVRETIAAMLPPEGAFDVTGPERELSTPVAQTLIRIAQESLTNVTRHAPGAGVRVRLAYRSDAVELDVVNDPPPGVASPAEGSGLGVVGMRERAALLGGTVTAGPTSSGGWGVEVRIPHE